MKEALFRPVFKSKSDIDSTPIVNGQLLIDRETFDLYVDAENKRHSKGIVDAVSFEELRELAFNGQLKPGSKYLVEYTFYHPRGAEVQKDDFPVAFQGALFGNPGTKTEPTDDCYNGFKEHKVVTSGTKIEYDILDQVSENFILTADSKWSFNRSVESVEHPDDDVLFTIASLFDYNPDATSSNEMSALQKAGELGDMPRAIYDRYLQDIQLIKSGEEINDAKVLDGTIDFDHYIGRTPGIEPVVKHIKDKFRNTHLLYKANIDKYRGCVLSREGLVGPLKISSTFDFRNSYALFPDLVDAGLTQLVEGGVVVRIGAQKTVTVQHNVTGGSIDIQTRGAYYSIFSYARLTQLVGHTRLNLHNSVIEDSVLKGDVRVNSSIINYGKIKDSELDYAYAVEVKFEDCRIYYSLLVSLGVDHNYHTLPEPLVKSSTVGFSILQQVEGGLRINNSTIFGLVVNNIFALNSRIIAMGNRDMIIPEMVASQIAQNSRPMRFENSDFQLQYQDGKGLDGYTIGSVFDFDGIIKCNEKNQEKFNIVSQRGYPFEIDLEVVKSRAKEHNLGNELTVTTAVHPIKDIFISSSSSNLVIKY